MSERKRRRKKKRRALPAVHYHCIICRYIWFRSVWMVTKRKYPRISTDDRRIHIIRIRGGRAKEKQYERNHSQWYTNRRLKINLFEVTVIYKRVFFSPYLFCHAEHYEKLGPEFQLNYRFRVNRSIYLISEYYTLYKTALLYILYHAQAGKIFF